MAGETVINLRLGSIIVLTSVVTAVVTGIASYAFMYGYQIKNEEVQEDAHTHLQREIDELRILTKEFKGECLHYTDVEVGGLRSDWERELNHK